MANLGEVTVKINAEMTETSKQVLRNEIIQILRDESVINELALAIERRIVSRLKYGRDPKIEVKE